MIANYYDDDNLDRVEEIYLTEKQCIQWVSTDTPRPDIFDTPEGRVVLKDMQTTDQPKSEPDYHKEMRAMIERAFGPSTNPPMERPVAPPAKPVRKLERPADAKWTFFCHASMVVGVHDDGTVVGRFTLWWPCNQEYRVTPDGVLHEHNKSVGERYMADGSAARIHGHFKRALTNWVKRGERRKMPVGIGRLKKAIDSYSPSGGGFETKRHSRPGDTITIYASDLF